jgi:hypothetical protein
MKARGRFDIVCVFEGGGYLRITSDPKRSLSAAEIVAKLRKYANELEVGVRAENERRANPHGRRDRG